VTSRRATSRDVLRHTPTARLPNRSLARSRSLSCSKSVGVEIERRRVKLAPANEADAARKLHLIARRASVLRHLSCQSAAAPASDWKKKKTAGWRAERGRPLAAPDQCYLRRDIIARRPGTPSARRDDVCLDVCAAAAVRSVWLSVVIGHLSPPTGTSVPPDNRDCCKCNVVYTIQN